jgi:hypothetical protein
LSSNGNTNIFQRKIFVLQNSSKLPDVKVVRPVTIVRACMISTELMAELRGLARPDKFYVMQLLISELAGQEEELLKHGQSYPVWSPYDACSAADTMLKMLETAKNQDYV